MAQMIYNSPSTTEMIALWRMLQHTKHRELRFDDSSPMHTYIKYLPAIEDGREWIIYKFDKQGCLIKVWQF